ncbi:hypothetical protein ACLOJK_018369 [Asimina triloba]
MIYVDRKIQEAGLDIQTTRNADHYGAVIHHLSLTRNKRCLMAYMYNRAEIIRSLRWKVGPVLPQEIQEKLNQSEEEYFKNHSTALESYMSELDLDLTVDMVPPKDPYIQVRVLDDIGEVLLGDQSASLVCHSVHSLKRTDAEPFISQLRWHIAIPRLPLNLATDVCFSVKETVSEAVQMPCKRRINVGPVLDAMQEIGLINFSGAEEIHCLEVRNITMAGGGAGDRSLKETPTWAVALVCAVMIFISVIIEHAIHSLGKWFQKKQKKAMLEALEKIKAELMLLGFISLLLTVTQKYIAKICIPVDAGNIMLPCKKEDDDHKDPDRRRRLLWYAADHVHGQAVLWRRGLAAAAGGDDHCAKK